MGISKFKSINELEDKIRELEGVNAENERLRRALQDMQQDFQEVLTLQKSIPEDCTPGEYCKACGFGKEIYHNYRVSGFTVRRGYDEVVKGYICNRAAVCKNFIQKEFE